MPTVTIFTGDNCKYCRMAKSALLIRDVEYTEVNVNEFPDMFRNRVPEARSVPQILIGEHLIGGYDRLSEIIDTPEFETLLKG